MRNKPITIGIIAMVSPVPLFVFTVIWCWILFFGIGIGVLHYDTVPLWMQIVGLLPLLISPALGIGGMIHGFIKFKEKLAWLGILLSVLCLVENCLLIYGMYYIGSRF